MSVKGASITVTFNGERLYEAYPENQVTVILDTQKLTTVAQALKENLAYVNDLLMKQSTSSTEAGTDEG